MTIAAEFTNGSKRRPAVLTINRIENGRRSFIHQVDVSGRREARKLAIVYGAEPWNF